MSRKTVNIEGADLYMIILALHSHDDADWAKHNFNPSNFPKGDLIIVLHFLILEY